MWYNKKRPIDITPPTKAQLITLRLMIIMGLTGMGLFMYGIMQEEHIGFPPLYYLLMFSLIFISLKIAYEWYHYFSISIPKQPPLKQKFEVDIFTTFCPGEPYEMIIETLEAIQKITYPHTTYLCDEGNDPFLIETCKRLGVKHVTRNNRINAKAGNVNNALKQATGDICVILDPDHVPAPDFLDHVLPHFQDPKIGFVQIVQAYKNIYENTIAKGSAQQTFQFYGPMMMTMSSYGTTQAIGANCTFRRAALDSIGGHAPGLAEDMNTSMKLHANGWKSIYVPKVLTRGLVPSSLSAYYKQQLKWSRGVFELLVTTYVQNFRKFTLRQKIHYGLLPWHYFSGVIYLINFLIPIISLLFGVMPMRMNLFVFLLWGSLFIGSTFLIRHYVQRWVMEEDERGFHLVGGLLLIGTWWIHLLGFIFTILRKKVPYNPTPKDGKDENTFGLNFPNITLGMLSVFAIIFGLYQDFNPYTLVMAGFAALNTLFIIFMIWISYQSRFRRYSETNKFAYNIALGLWYIKRPLWIFRHKVYGWVRILALPMLILLISGLYYYASNRDITLIEPLGRADMHTSKYTGIFAPADTTGQTNLPLAESLSEELGFTPGIISTYLAWSDKSDFPTEFLKEVYQKNAYPMITWEPWLEGFSAGSDPEMNSMERIAAGQFDDFLTVMSENFKTLEKPLFLRFAHEPDNPAYPWYSDKPSAAEDYKQAWRHVHTFMKKQGVDNLIWVYNPWKPAAATAYFPGGDYVDWLGVTALNYAAAVSQENWNSFHDLYAPFQRTLAFQEGLPVMVAEFGTLDGKGNTKSWYQDALYGIEKNYPQIKACVLFASNFDQNIPQEKATDEMLKWADHAPGFTIFSDFQENFLLPTATVPAQPPVATVPAQPVGGPGSIPREDRNFYQGIEGVNYVKGQDWQASMHPLFKKTVLYDFQAMQKLNLTWIKRYGPGVYDNTILNSAREKGLNIIYALWIEKNVDFLRQKEKLETIRHSIIKSIKKNKSEETIKAWHIGNPVWDHLAENFSKPQLLYQREAYLNWLANLTEEIKSIDPSRPVSIELNMNAYLKETASIIEDRVPHVDAIGVNIKSKAAIDTFTKQTYFPLSIFINKLPGQPAEVYDQIRTGWLLNAWQDDVFENYVSFDGLLDHHGRKKIDYQQLQLRSGDSMHVNLPQIEILRPAQLTTKGKVLRYQALLSDGEKWTLAAFNHRNLDYTWQLVKLDAYGNALAMRDEGKGVAIDVTIPPEPHRYLLRLIASKGDYSTSAEIPLNTPVYEGPELEELSREEIDYLFKESKKE